MTDSERRALRGCDKPKEMFVPWSIEPIYRCPNAVSPIAKECVQMWADWKAGFRFAQADIMELPAFVRQGLVRCENAAAEFYAEQRRQNNGGSGGTNESGLERALGPGKYKRLS